MVRRVLTHAQVALHGPCEWIAVAARTRAVLADMTETLEASSGFAVSAPQIGRAIRAIAVRDPDDLETIYALANPRITRRSLVIVWSSETCLSAPWAGAKSVRRAASVDVAGIDPLGDPVLLSARGKLAAYLQHAIGHLDGVCAFDVAGAPAAKKL